MAIPAPIIYPQPVIPGSAVLPSPPWMDIVRAVDNHVARVDNPHNVTAEQVGTYDKDTIDSKIASVIPEQLAKKANTPYGYIVGTRTLSPYQARATLEYGDSTYVIDVGFAVTYIGSNGVGWEMLGYDTSMNVVYAKLHITADGVVVDNVQFLSPLSTWKTLEGDELIFVDSTVAKRSLLSVDHLGDMSALYGKTVRTVNGMAPDFKGDVQVSGLPAVKIKLANASTMSLKTTLNNLITALGLAEED